MKIFDFKNKKNVFVVGDIHGEFKQFFNVIKNRLECDTNERRRPRFRSTGKKINNSIIIVAGDCGMGFNKLEYYNMVFKDIDELLAKVNSTIIFVRGNHDDPKYFNEKLIDSKNIICVPDYSIIQSENENILCVGGGISLDRMWRIEQEKRLNKYSKSKSKKIYWIDEPFIYDEDELNKIIESNIPITSVVTHIAPDFAKPSNNVEHISWFKLDEKLKDDVTLERSNVTKMYNFLIEKKQDIKTWFYGHYHISESLIKDDKTIFLALDTSMRLTDVKEISNSLHKKDNELPFPQSFLSDMHGIILSDRNEHRHEENEEFDIDDGRVGVIDGVNDNAEEAFDVGEIRRFFDEQRNRREEHNENMRMEVDFNELEF